MNTTPAPSRPEDEARRLLVELNQWVFGHDGKQARPLPPPQPDLKSTGESNARIAQLKSDLRAVGARFHRAGGRYVLDGMAAVGQGGEGQADDVGAAP